MTTTSSQRERQLEADLASSNRLLEELEQSHRADLAQLTEMHRLALAQANEEKLAAVAAAASAAASTVVVDPMELQRAQDEVARLKDQITTLKQQQQLQQQQQQQQRPATEDNDDAQSTMAQLLKWIESLAASDAFKSDDIQQLMSPTSATAKFKLVRLVLDGLQKGQAVVVASSALQQAESTKAQLVQQSDQYQRQLARLNEVLAQEHQGRQALETTIAELRTTVQEQKAHIQALSLSKPSTPVPSSKVEERIDKQMNYSFYNAERRGEQHAREQ